MPLQNQNELFSILDSVDSSNNYAMAKAQAGMAKHGQAWFARDQFSGRGQRGKTWQSIAGENIILSIVINPRKAFARRPFLLSALVANCCAEFFADYAGAETKIKWPNDIYWRDRKTGGILIENIYQGKEWARAIIGIGININQEQYDDTLNASSLKNITGKIFDPEKLAEMLHEKILLRIDDPVINFETILSDYNKWLYKRGEAVLLKKKSAVFPTTITGVNEYGQLLTHDALQSSFDFGEVSWVIKS